MPQNVSAPLWAVPVLFSTAVMVWSGSLSLLDDQSFTSGGTPLIASARPAQALLASLPATDVPAARGSSLFQGRETGTFFEPPPVRVAPPAPPRLTGGYPGLSGVAGLRHLIASVEAGRAGYNAVQHAARIRPSKPPTQMTIAEIYRWIKDTPGQQHAIGRYQLIPATLRRLVADMGLSVDTVYSPQVQDALADLLLEEAGFREFQAGLLGHTAFMNNLAKIWAGLPNSSGKSHYHGFAGNHAGMSWERFASEMQRIFPRG